MNPHDTRSFVRGTAWRRYLSAAAIALALAAAASLSARADGPAAGDAPAAKRATVVILHTNDWHGSAFATKPATSRRNGPERPPSGGVAACAAAVKKARAERPGGVLVLDGGDLLSGHPAADFVDDGVKGAAFVRLWASIGFDAWIVGNHDLDHGLANLKGIIPLARAPALAANLLAADRSGPAAPTLPYKVFDVSGIKVGVIGLTTGDLARLLRAETLAEIAVVPPLEAARPLVEKLRPEVDLLLALTHLGHEADQELARALPQLDAIVGGHSHRSLKEPIVVGRTLIVQAGAKGRQLGRLELTVEVAGGARKVVAHDYRLLPLPYVESEVPEETLALSKALEARCDALGAEVIGETTAALRRGNYYREHDCGSFIADAIRLATKADVGFINSGGVRAELPKGKVTRADLLEVLPFDDELCTFEATGAELEAICRHNALAAITQDHGILQVSGLRYRFRKTEDGKAEIVSLEVGGKPVDRAKKYVCATNRFLAFEQAEKYFGYVPAARTKLGTTIQAAVAAAFQNGPVERPDRRRIWEERGEPAAVPAGAEPRDRGKGDDEGTREEGGD